MNTNNSEQKAKSYLLTQTGLLMQSGRAKEMLYEYDRLAVPPVRRFLRLKERDRYIFGNSQVQIELSLADYGYAGVVCASVVNLETGSEKTTVLTTPLTLGSLELKASPNWGDVIFRAKGEASFDFGKSTGKRHIRGRVERFDDVRSLYVNIVLEEPQSEQFCCAEGQIAQPECFCLSHKIMNMTASGTVVYGADTYSLQAEDSFACLDWERAVMPKYGESSWCCAQGMSDGVPAAFSFSGQKDLLRPNVNAVFYDGEVYDPGEIKIYPGQDKHEGELTLKSVSGKLELTFKPLVTRYAEPKLLWIPFAHSELTYGVWNGRIKLGRNKSVEIKDMTGFAENASFRW